MYVLSRVFLLVVVVSLSCRDLRTVFNRNFHLQFCMNDVALRWSGVLGNGRRSLFARVNPDEAVLNGGRQSVPSVRHALALVLAGSGERPHRVEDLKPPRLVDTELRHELHRIPVLLQSSFKCETAIELLLRKRLRLGHGANWRASALRLVLRDLRDTPLELVQRLRGALHLLLYAVDHVVPLRARKPNEIVLREFQPPGIHQL
mmetsp:Transcript_22765/g.44391  ORF Transcript_22765/g.44391 Transcript_22765/m.44391 type:complete len:204 (-) Transcript_22765:353-964(-)